MKLLPADIVLTSAQGGGLLSRLILWGTRDPGEPPTRASHIALVSKPAAENEWARASILIESTWPRVIESRRLEYYLHELQISLTDGGVLIFRRKDLTMHGRIAVVEAAREHVGERYGALGLYWQLVRAVAAKSIGYPIYWVGRLFGKRWRGPQFRSLARHNLTKPVYCSQLAALAFESIGVMITEKMTDDEVAELVGRRQEAKEKRDFAEADKIRDQLLKHGVILKDKSWGVRVWREWTTLTAAKPEMECWFDYNEAKRKAKKEEDE